MIQYVELRHYYSTRTRFFSIKSYFNISLDVEQCEYSEIYLKVKQLILVKIIAF